MPRRLLVLFGALLVTLAVTVTVVAKPGAAEASRTSVGKVQGTDAFLAVTHDGERLRAYVCDGSARRLATMSTWFEARWDGRSRISVVSDGIELEIERVGPDGRVVGRLDGRRFTLTPATGPAGLYDRKVRTSRVTSVVLPNGDIRGAMIDPRPRKCRPVQVTLVDGTTQVVTVCKAV
jgi:hypothetical protein